jgi:hypothetical protein
MITVHFLSHDRRACPSDHVSMARSFVFDDAKNPTNLYLGPLGKDSQAECFKEFFTPPGVFVWRVLVLTRCLVGPSFMKHIASYLIVVGVV